MTSQPSSTPAPPSASAPSAAPPSASAPSVRSPAPAPSASAPSFPPSASLELGALVQRIRPRLKRILSGYGVPPQDADDLLQEVFFAAFRDWESIENQEAWLVGTLRISCARYWRRRRKSLLEAVDSTLLELLCEPQPAPQERAALVWDLETLIDTLSARHRAVLRLRFGLGLITAEVADRLGYCPASIRKLTRRSLARLRQAVSPDPPPPAPPTPPSSSPPSSPPAPAPAPAASLPPHAAISRS
jgi:RNA polymerase sigma factor (sigma-70 family)